MSEGNTGFGTNELQMTILGSFPCSQFPAASFAAPVVLPSCPSAASLIYTIHGLDVSVLIGSLYSKPI
jgi:hypothetical protein